MSDLITFLAASPASFIATCLVFGLLVGSFLNVVIYRLPLMLEREWLEEIREMQEGTAEGPPPAPAEPFNLVVPRSACPACKTPITALQNIPVVSYLFLKGRCAGCGARISPRYPAIEALTGLLSAAVAWKLGFGWPIVAGLVFTWYLIALAFIDIDSQLLPDRLTFPLLWIGLFLSLWSSQAGGAPIPMDPREAIIGAIAGYVSLWSVYHLFRLLTGKEGMGYGDFKLFAALGAWLGWKMLIPIILLAATVGAVIGGTMMVILGRDRSTRISFGPYLAAAGWLTLMFGRELWMEYMGLFALQP